MIKLSLSMAKYGCVLHKHWYVAEAPCKASLHSVGVHLCKARFQFGSSFALLMPYFLSSPSFYCFLVLLQSSTSQALMQNCHSM